MIRRSVPALAACLATAGLLSLFSASALAVVSTLLPTLLVELDGKTSPAKLPTATSKPIALTLEGKISEPGSAEERPPALKTLSLQFDRNSSIFTKGLATCRPPSGPDTGWGGRCPEALVGHGEVEFEIKLSEGPAFRTESPLLIYNAAAHDGPPVLIYSVYAHVPAPTTFITSGVIEKGHGRFGAQTTIPIPKMVSGKGSLIGFRATIGKTWTYKGKKVSLLSARCPKGSLAAHAELEFVDGTKFEGELAAEKCR